MPCAGVSLVSSFLVLIWHPRQSATLLGVGLDGSMAFLEETLDYRKYGLPHNLLAVENCDEWLYCLDCDTGEVVSWSQVDGVLPGYPSFGDFLLQDLEDAIENL